MNRLPINLLHEQADSVFKAHNCCSAESKHMVFGLLWQSPILPPALLKDMPMCNHSVMLSPEVFMVS